ncbi:heme/copper-type cytochrome/quinol oxidase subunit 1 [Micromonospora sp. A200]|nr:heme/copper-type cytochrome/quinol oxidase subunit 1 [Micromonospora sp. A200]
MFITALMAVVVFPLLSATLLGLLSDRLLDSHIFDSNHGGPMIYQHLFCYFGHPEVYIVALPFFGIISEIIPVFSRKPLFGYKGMVLALWFIFFYSLNVSAHHMFATGQVLLPFFSATTFVIAVPTGVKFFNWIGTMWKGQITFETPMLFAVGFLVTFLFGGLTGVLLASPPVDFHVHDSYFVVGHFHYVLFGTIVFAAFAGVYFWFPKMTGRMLDEKLGKMHFWTMFLGFHLTFLVHHWLGNEGMPRRYADYLPQDGFTALHTVSTIGSFILGVSTLFFIYNVWRSWRFGAAVSVDDPWGYGNSLEWATTCPPPLRNFDRMPHIRSERPAFDAKYGTLVADLGRDLPQRAARPPQKLGEELRREKHVPEPPSAGGAQGADEVTAYQPAPQSGARPVEVPQPEEARRPSFADSHEPEEDPLDAQRGDDQSPRRWRHPGESDDDRT